MQALLCKRHEGVNRTRNLDHSKELSALLLADVSNGSLTAVAG